MHTPQPIISENDSQRIAMVRTLCIFGMIYVHVPSANPDSVMYGLDLGDLFGSAQAFLVEGFGRASACLLSVVSGYLTARVLVNHGGKIGNLYRKRFASIVVPMALWGTMTVGVYALVSLSRPTFLNISSDGNLDAVLQYLNFVFFITDTPVGATMHLAFLRDLFVCVLLSPLLLFALKRAATVTLATLLLVYLLDLESVIVLRPLIVLSYTAGMWLLLCRANLHRLDKFWVLWIALSSLCTLLIMHFNAGFMPVLNDVFAARGLDAKESLLYPVSRLFGALAIWTITALLLGSRVQWFLTKLSPYIFAAYCSHYIVLTLLFFGVWQPFWGGEGPMYGVWFFLAPLIAMAVACAMVNLVAMWFPGFALLLTGGRQIPQLISRAALAERSRM